MEQRVKLAELKAHLAEERAQRNQSLLNQKLQEVNHLQHQLNSQTKVLRHGNESKCTSIHFRR